MKSKIVKAALTGLGAIFAAALCTRAANPPQPLLNDPVDISGDFHDFSDTYFLADKVASFDPAAGTGTITYQRARYSTRQAFDNMARIAATEGASLHDAVRLVIYVTDMARHRPLVNRVQEDLWGGGPYPPRTIVEVSRLNQEDIVEVEGTFFAPIKSA